MKKILLLPVFLALILLLAGCTQQNPQPPVANGSVSQNATLTAQYGDNVTVDYTLRVDGKVLDTSDMGAAKQAGIYSQNRSYQPISFQLLLDNGLINGFVNGILGMKVGETKSFTVAPADGYGPVNSSKIMNMSRYYNMSVFEDVPMDYFIAKNITVKKNAIFPTAFGFVAIENYTNDTVTIHYMLQPGQQFAYAGFPESVVNITNDTLFIRYDVEENKSYQITDPVTGQPRLIKVTHADNETVVLDENSPLAGKELDFDVTLRALSR